MGPYKPLRTWVDEFIPYYMEIIGVDRPDRTYEPRKKKTGCLQGGPLPVVNGAKTTINGPING